MTSEKNIPLPVRYHKYLNKLCFSKFFFSYEIPETVSDPETKYINEQRHLSKNVFYFVNRHFRFTPEAFKRKHVFN